MSTNPLNDISKVYLDQIAEKKKDDTYLEPDMKKRQANNEKARKELAKGPQMKNPHFESVEVEEEKKPLPKAKMFRKAGNLGRDAISTPIDPEKRQKAYDRSKKIIKTLNQNEGLDPVGKEDGDIDNDGDKDSSDKYLLKRRKAIGKAMKKRLKEERESLSEVMDDTEAQKTVKEKKVNNKIVINPKLGEAVEEMGGTLIEHIEVDEMDFIIESVYDELIEEGYTEDDVEAAIENAMEATVTFGHDTKALKKDGSQVGSRRKFLKRKAGEFLQKAKEKAGMASAQAQVAAYNKGREVKQNVADKVRGAKVGLKGKIKKAAQKVVDRMSEEVVDEAVYGGEPEKKKDTRMVVTNADKKANTPAYQRMKAGDKRYKAADHMKEGVYGADSSMRKAAAKERAAEKKAGSKAKSPGRLGPSAGKSYADHEAHSIKAHDKITKKTKPSVLGMTSEDADLDKMQKDADANRARAAKLKDRNVTRGSASFAAAKVADDVKKAARTGPQQHKGTRTGVKKIEKPKPTHTKTGVMRTEEASMSPQELQLQKKKARIDRMIAMKRSQNLSKQKAGDEQPAKAMGEATEDSLRDRRMERGGVDGNVRYDKAPKFAPGPAKKSSGSQKAIDFVRKEITAKYGKGALIDTKTKKTGYK